MQLGEGLYVVRGTASHHGGGRRLDRSAGAAARRDLPEGERYLPGPASHHLQPPTGGVQAGGTGGPLCRRPHHPAVLPPRRLLLSPGHSLRSGVLSSVFIHGRDPPLKGPYNSPASLHTCKFQEINSSAHIVF